MKRERERETLPDHFEPPRRTWNSIDWKKDERGWSETESLCSDYFWLFERIMVTRTGTTFHTSLQLRKVARSASTARNEVSRSTSVLRLPEQIFGAWQPLPLFRRNHHPRPFSSYVKEVADNIGPGPSFPRMEDHAPFRIVGIISCIYCAVSTRIV